MRQPMPDEREGGYFSVDFRRGGSYDLPMDVPCECPQSSLFQIVQGLLSTPAVE